MIAVQFEEAFPISSDLLEQAAQAALTQCAAPADADMVIVLADDAHLHELNRQFLDIDAPTDVLSFPSGDIDPETGHPYLGDVIISVERARQQAVDHSLEDELRLLVVHGTLHLLGFDHADDEEKQQMWAAQSAVLKRIGGTALG